MTNLTMDVMGGLKKRLVDNGDGTFAELIAIEANGSTGKDWSVNAPALPVVGANFAGSGPFASYVLVKTVAANTSRNNVEIKNLTGDQIAVVRDDGTAASSAPPLNASAFALAGGASAGQQGAAWSSTTFRGRLQIYAPAALSGSAFIAVLED